MTRRAVKSDKCVFGDCDEAMRSLNEKTKGAEMDVNGVFNEAEIKALLQVGRDLDLCKVTEASRSKAFWSLRKKFQHMVEHSANGKSLKQGVCMVCGFSNQCVVCCRDNKEPK